MPQQQTISWTNAGLLNENLVIDLSDIYIKIQQFFIHENALENVVYKMSAISSQPQRFDGTHDFLLICQLFTPPHPTLFQVLLSCHK